MSRRSDRRYYPEGSPFYTMRNVAEYTFAPYKVVWREQASELTTAIAVGHERPLVPDHKLMLVSCGSANEAFFLTACLNSVISRLLVKGYVIGTQISTHVLEHVAVPKFDSSSTLHQSLASLSMQAHRLATKEGKEGQSELRKLEEEIDRLAAQIWGLTEEELLEVHRSLERLG